MTHYTQCPACATVYAFNPAALSYSGGQARCGGCGAIFDAYLKVYTQLPPLPETSVPPSALWDDTPTEAPESENPFGAPTPPQPSPLPERLAWIAEQWQEPQPTPFRWGWGLASLALGLLLVGQFASMERARLVQRYPELYPWFAQACGWLACTLPPQLDPKAWKILSREVGPHPGRQKAWLAEISFMNDAAFSQPYPLLELVLLDERGLALAGRRFTPAEYLPQSAPIASLAPAQATVFARLELQAPDPSASGFRFRFYSES